MTLTPATPRAAPSMAADASAAFTPASALLAASPTPTLSLNDAHLDALFPRGLPLRGLLEVSGEAGSGKTALAMQVALHACAARGTASLIVNTEGPFPAARLVDMARAMRAGGAGGAGGGGGGGVAGAHGCGRRCAALRRAVHVR